jgi:hypothetical protein
VISTGTAYAYIIGETGLIIANRMRALLVFLKFLLEVFNPGLESLTDPSGLLGLPDLLLGGRTVSTPRKLMDVLDQLIFLLK